MRVGLQWEWELSWGGWGEYLGHRKDESTAAGVMLQLHTGEVLLVFNVHVLRMVY